MKLKISLCFFVFLVMKIHGDCLYPEWKKTCQKYCMDHQLTDIQFNQCYSNQIKCQCNGQDLTEKIRTSFQPTTTSISTTEETKTTNETISCVANESCVNGQRVCQTKYSFCNCENEKWISQICPQGNICKKDSSNVSCQLASIDDDPSVSSSSSSTSLSFFVHKRFLHFFFILVTLII